LYPYVPRVDQFQEAITAAWSAVQPTVGLSFNSDWDGGYSSDPSGMDVFVFDAIFLDYFRAQSLLATLGADEVRDKDDYLPYAIDGVKQEGGYSGVPMLGCANVLFYRTGDTAVAAATTLTQVFNALGQCRYTSQVPPDVRGLMLDMAGGTTNACLYVDITQSIDGAWPPQLPPTPAELNPTSVQRMQKLLATSSYYNATKNPSAAYGRAAWFSQDEGRVTMGFTESMSAMSAETRAQIEFKLFPLGDKSGVSPLFYSDVIGISPSTQNRALAVQLANLMASTDVMVAAMEASGDEPPQFLMPSRTSIFQELSRQEPIYSRMQAMVASANPILFNLGNNARGWIDAMKNPIKQQSRANYACGCDEDAGPISSQSRANEVCPQVCAQFGGWNGQWTPYPPGGTETWKGGCGCKTCPVQ
jgi:thiamine pyridinylase